MNAPVRCIYALTLAFIASSACSGGTARDDDEAGERAERSESASDGMIDLPAVLLERAEVTLEVARSAALARVVGGRVTAGELEEEDGRLIYSFDVRVDGRDGIEEVHVDALTGEVIAQEHEGAPDEADPDERS